MAARKVYEGRTVLNLKEWLDGLKTMETSTKQTAANLNTAFRNLDRTINRTLTSIKTSIQTVATELTQISSTLSGANAAITRGEQLAQQANDNAQQQLRQAQRTRQEMQALAAAERAELQQQLAALRLRNREEERERERHLANLLELSRRGGRAEAAEQEKIVAYRRRELETFLRDEEQFYVEALQRRAAALRGISEAGTNQEAAAAARAALAQAERDAALHYERLRSLDRQYTMEYRANVELRRLADKQSAEELRKERLEAQRGGVNLRQSLRAEAELARMELIQVEDSINAVYRAGSQITQLGSMMLAFAGGISFLGARVAQAAGDFDFWISRAMAATQAANEMRGVAIDPTIVSMERFRDIALSVGREVGALAPAQVAEGWFTYQAAVGDAIRSVEDLQVAAFNVNETLKASVITNTDVSTVIRGTASAMAEFGMDVSGYGYALAVMANAAQVTQAEFGDLLNTFKTVGPQARQFNMTLGDTAAMASMAAEVGLRGTQVGRLFGSGLLNLTGLTNKQREALQDLFVTQRGLTGQWEDFLYRNGEFIGLFNRQIAETGEIQKGALAQFYEATKNLSSAERMYRLGLIFGKDAGKVWATIINQYAEAEEAAREAGEGTINRFEALAQTYNDSSAQLEAFGKQWETVSQSLKVRLGVLGYAFEEFRMRMGVILGTTVAPLLEFVGTLIYRFLEWAETHPEVANGLTAVATGATILMGVLGTLLIMLGATGQALAGLPIILQSLSSGWSLVTGTVRSFAAILNFIGGRIPVVGALYMQLRRITEVVPLLGRSVFLLNPALWAVIGALGLLAYAWYTNWNGIRDGTAEVIGLIMQEFGALVEMLGAVATLLTGVFTGNQSLVEQGGREFVEAFLRAFYVIPLEIGTILDGALQAVFVWFGELVTGMYSWGVNLMQTLAEGIYAGAAHYVAAAVAWAASLIGLYFEGHSPPRYGPLRGIQEWGRNLMETFAQGMREADISAVEEVADRIGEAIRRNVEAGLVEASSYAEAVGEGHNIIDTMLALVRGGSRVNEEFFASLLPYLGEWYDYIIQISLAYQDVYANERQLAIEKEKLAAIRAQRQELQAANKARIDAFELELGRTDGSSFWANEDAMVDPTTPEGQARIRQMRERLSREDFQNWLNFQKRLWEERGEFEDRSLAAQEESLQAQIDLLTRQLEAAQEQYNYYVAMYEYAVKLYELAEEQARLEESRGRAGGGGGGGRLPTIGSEEVANAFVDLIRGIIGPDQPLLDERTLREMRGGDDIGAYSDAARQLQQEQDRLAALEAENRRRRSQYEMDLIRAKSDAERAAIKADMDAWDAAYKQERGRLQERLQFAREIQEAAEKQADATKAGRIEEQQIEFQREITEEIGLQTDEIRDANRLKEEGGDLDKAQILARRQLRDEERKLRDLQALGDKKRLEYEQKIREAANDPERLRRIKEEQEAWETAYKMALEAQQLRVELARRAQQDLQDEAAELQETGKKKKTDGAPDFSGVGPLGDSGFSLDEVVQQAREEAKKMWEAIFNTEETSETGTKTQKVLDDLRRAITFLSDESVPAEEKVRALGRAIAEFLGWTDEQGQFDPERALGHAPLMEWANNFEREQKESLDKANGVIKDFVLKAILGAFEGIGVDPDILLRVGSALKSGFNGLIGGAMTFLSPDPSTIGQTGHYLKIFLSGLISSALGLLGPDPETANRIAEALGKYLQPVANFLLAFKSGDWEAVSEAGRVVQQFFSSTAEGAQTWWTNITRAWDIGEGGILATVTAFLTGPTGLQVLFSGGFGTIYQIATDFLRGENGLDTLFQGGLRTVADIAWDWLTNGESGLQGIFSGGLAGILLRVTEFFTGEGGTNSIFTNNLDVLKRLVGSFFTEEGGINPTFTSGLGAILLLVGTFFNGDRGLLSEWARGTQELLAKGVDFLFGENGLITKWDGAKKTWEGIVRGLITSLETVFNPITSFVRALSGIRFPSIPSWLGGGGGQETGGGRAGGSFAQGLKYVPYDLFPAYLHKGERVLTAAEAAAYNAFEAAVKQGSSALAMAHTTVNSANTARSMTVNIGRIDASDPDQGRALISQLAFLGS